MVVAEQEEEVPKRILAIDDGVEIIQLISMLLSANGYEVDVALGGREGLLHAMKQMPDLILLDYMMPDKDGIEVLQELRCLPGYEDLPVIMLTAQAQGDVIQRAMKLNVAEYVLKPFELTGLLQRIQKYI